MKLRRITKINPHLGKLKPYNIPEGMILIQDTREQLPLFNNPPDDLTIIIDTVKDGDYTIKGFDSYFSIERKMMSDFYSYIGAEYESKTIGKMERFKAMVDRGGFVGLAIEESEDAIYYGSTYSQMSPENARQSINTFRVKYKVDVYINKNRECIERYVLDTAIRYFRLMRNGR